MQDRETRLAKRRETERRYREANPEKQKEWRKAWVAKNREKINEYSRNYQRARYQKKRIKDDPERLWPGDPGYRQDVKLRRAYGITKAQYDMALDRQGGVCDICKQPETTGGKRALSVDHDHTTGAVRGLLCRKCNTGIGNFGDSVENMKLAIEYLEKHTKIVQ